MENRNLGQQMLAEFIGTFALVFIGAGSVAVLGRFIPADISIIGVALAHGLVLAIVVTALGHISGAHFNPAITLGLWVTGKIDAARAGVYWLTQLVAAVAAAGLLYGLLPKILWGPSELGTPSISPQLKSVGFNAGRGLLVEAVLTFFLVLTVFATAIDERGAWKQVAGLAIGLVLTFDILMGGLLTGAAMNPARWFGPALVTGSWNDWWVWVFGPLAGGVIAAVIYQAAFLRPPAVDDEELELTEEVDVVDVEQGPEPTTEA
ncbi:MAG TPA: MIP/aquaporin family protein [Actinomycetota bacterium]